MEISKPNVFVSKLVLAGKRKNYVVPFRKGVNIIYGDSATGKSSILECINYLLGSSRLVYDREIEASVDYIMMEVFLNNNPYVIKRDIFKPNDPIEVYEAELDFISTVFPAKLTPNYKLDVGPDGYFADFLMSALNIPKIKMRQAPTRADSQMVRLSFRDLFKYSYLKQDDVGSKGVLGAGNYALEIKSKETFKYIFNLLDTNVSDTQAELAELINERNRLRNKYDAVSDFLRETEFDSETTLGVLNVGLATQENALRAELSSVNQRMVANNESYLFLKGTLNDILTSIAITEKDKAASELAVDRFVRLKNDYLNDIQKLKSIRLANSLIGAPEETFSCPICDSTVRMDGVKDDFLIDESDRVGQEVNTLTRRIREIDVLVQSERDKQSRFGAQLKSLIDERDKARLLIDEEAAQMITPYLSERDGLASELAKIEEKRKQLTHLLKVRNQQKIIFSAIADFDKRVISMQEKLNLIKAAAPSLDEVLSQLGDYLGAYLRWVKIKDQRETSISPRTFLPVLRGRDYRDITSGGLRTVLSIGHYLGIVEAAASSFTNAPAFLMIDTVGKYLGKTQDRYQEAIVVDDDAEELSDPAKYLNIYTYMFDLAERAEKSGASVQMILVDNDVPPQIQADYPDSIVAHFNKEGTDQLPRGLIDDAYLFNI